MRNRLLIGFVLFAFIAMALLVIPIGFTLSAHENTSTLRALQRDTGSLSLLLANDIGRNHLSDASKLARTYARTTGRQIFVVQGGVTLVASNGRRNIDPDLVSVIREVRTTQLSGVTSLSGAKGPQYFVAIHLPDDRTAVHSLEGAVVLMTYPVTIVTKIIRSNWRNLGLYGVAMLVLACVFGFFISTSLTRPLRKIASAVDAIGRGKLDVRAPVTRGPPELRRLAETINATSSRLIDLLNAQKTFVEDASHQLRTPLTALQLHLENLQHEEHFAPAELTLVLSEVGRLGRLIESLLELARNESRAPVLAPIDVGEAARLRIEVWSALAAERGLDLTIAPHDVVKVLVIEGVIEQVLENLLANAFDATPAGGRITVTVSRSESFGQLHVIDSGVGLSVADRELALRRFWRSRANDAEGSGLGLAIVDQLVRLSGGSIHLLEAPGGGIDATVLLRLAP